MIEIKSADAVTKTLTVAMTFDDWRRLVFCIGCAIGGPEFPDSDDPLMKEWWEWSELFRRRTSPEEIAKAFAG